MKKLVWILVLIGLCSYVSADNQTGYFEVWFHDDASDTSFKYADSFLEYEKADMECTIYDSWIGCDDVVPLAKSSLFESPPILTSSGKITRLYSSTEYMVCLPAGYPPHICILYKLILLLPYVGCPDQLGSKSI